MDNESRDDLISEDIANDPSSSGSTDEEVNDSGEGSSSGSYSGPRTYNGRDGIINDAARGMDRLSYGANNLSNRLKSGGDRLNNYANKHQDSKLGKTAGSMGDRLNKAGNKVGNLGNKLNNFNRGVQTANNLNNAVHDPSAAKEMAAQKAKQVAKDTAKKAAKEVNKKVVKATGKTLAKFLLTNPYFWLILGIVVGAFILFLVIYSAFFTINFSDSDGISSGNNVVYQSDCNYENTKVVVMDSTNTQVLATVSLEDYILGVVCPEIGACSGQVAKKEEHYIKVKFVAAKTYTLARGRYNSATKSVTIRASTRDQQWCDLNKGCVVTNDGKYLNTFPGDYSGSQTIEHRYSYTEEDLQLLRQYYADTYGDLFLKDSYNDVITSLNGNDLTSYKSSTQIYWQNQAISGKSYIDILENTGASGVTDSQQYVGKSIYKLGTYCKSTDTGSSGLDEAIGEVEYLSGGLNIPIYYQNDYKDVILKDDKTVSSSGCGFTSSAMIVSYLLGKKITPREFVDDWSRVYYVYDKGMDHGLPDAAANHYGLGNVKPTTSYSEMVQALRDGHPVMSSQGPGLFTSGGHLIVLRGVTLDGKILVNDPNKKNAITRGYNTRAFTKSEIEAANKKYFIWPKKST